MRRCEKCNKLKEDTCFNKYSKVCDCCKKEHQRAYNKMYREKHLEDLKAYQKKYRENNKEILKEKQKEYHKRWYAKNKETKLLKNKEWLASHKEQRTLKIKEWETKNHDRILQQKLKRRKERLKEDSVYKLKTQTRDVIKKSFRGVLKGKRGKTTEILGCDLDFFVKYLLETYKNNYGVEWDRVEKVHIDHIIPLATAKTKEDVIELCRYTNLQLLKAKDNLKKSSKMDWRLENDI